MAFIEDLYAAWEKHGMAAIEATAKNHPAQFLKVIAMLMPKDLNLNINPYANLSDEQLTARLKQVTGLLSYQSTISNDQTRTPLHGDPELIRRRRNEAASGPREPWRWVLKND